MSYTVLARKWRPRSFAELAGQEHVRRALVNALDGDRLHHAFLFTGTRGVGKTTVARILAKCLNCEKGVSSEPCGECANCTEIDEGRFVDLIEVDAASRTKVDDTRELLDNVQYRPTRGVFKVYLIDEVHMLSKHSFNALLKTLEEPPEHVKFLLATTDPQKLPVTVLSRCLQFNLKKLPLDLIVERLRLITGSEEVESEEGALARLARAADGSMRDALSLLDQAISFGGGKLTDGDVLTMLGSIDRQDIAAVLQAVVAGDAAAVMENVAAMDEHAPDYDAALGDIASLLQRAALAQLVPDALDDSQGDRELAMALAESAGAEELQLYYQIALIGRRDLYLAANPRGGFEMVLLRMLAFRPAGAGDSSGTVAPKPPQAARPKAGAAPRRKKAGAPKATTGQSAGDPVDWAGMIDSVSLRGAARELATNCVFSRREGHVWHLTLDERHGHLLTEQQRERLSAALSKAAGTEVSLRIHLGRPADATPAEQQVQAAEDELDTARENIARDPNVKALKDLFGATVVEESVRPDNGGKSGA